jgi:phosphoserine phosphatase RsbU/P
LGSKGDKMATVSTISNRKKVENTQPKNIDALVITNQGRIFKQIKKLLEEKKLSWELVSVDDLKNKRDEFGLVGTAIVETSAIDKEQKSEVTDIIRWLEADGVATVLVNNHINFPAGNYDLVSVLETGSIEELRGRLTGNIAYRNKLAKVDEIIEDQAAEELEEQLRMAGQVQRDFLPAKLPDTKSIDWSVMFEPADWVSGDIYDARRLDEQHIGFYVADAVGHSMPAALLTMFLKQALTMRETTGNDYRIFSPVEVIKNLNQKMVEQNLSGSLFTTCCYCLLNTRTLQLNFARAGHPYPVLIKNNNKAELLQCRGGLLGVFGEAEFTQETVQLEKGDRLLLYSDGVESVIGRTEDNGEFEFDEGLLSITDLGIKRFMEMFNILVRNRTVNNAERDDVTALGLEIL